MSQFPGRLPGKALLALMTLSSSLIVVSTHYAMARGDRDRFPTVQQDRTDVATEEAIPADQEPRRFVPERHSSWSYEHSSWSYEQRSFTYTGSRARHTASHVRPLARIVSKETGASQSSKVSIYEDRTLRRGDAVMTEAGLRIFSGSATFPYRPSDFTDLETSHAVSKSLRYSLNAYAHQIPLPAIAEEAPVMTVHLNRPVLGDLKDDIAQQAVVSNVSLLTIRH